MNNSTSRIKVYYNSACPVCKAGIEGQKARDSICEIEWNDIHLQNQLVNEINSELEFVRERLHVVDEHGKLQVGFDAFLVVWRNSPGELWKAKVFGLPVVKQLSRIAYNIFAALLYSWNKALKHW